MLWKKRRAGGADMRLVLMSATLGSTRLFEEYFGEMRSVDVGVKRFPVEVMYLDDLRNDSRLRVPADKETRALLGKAAVEERASMERAFMSSNRADAVQTDRIVALFKQGVIPMSSSVLVFLPGINAIETLAEALQDRHVHGNAFVSTLEIFLLHSSIDGDMQQKVMEPVGEGNLRVVLATNIAESSVTLPAVDVVIDTGTHKYVEERALVVGNVSQSAATQRIGRAGRVKPGIAYRLYTRQDFNYFDPDARPEILRVQLASTYVRVMGGGLDPDEALASVMQPPPQQRVARARAELLRAGAIDGEGNVHLVGHMATQLAVDLQMCSFLSKVMSVGGASAAFKVVGVVIAAGAGKDSVFSRPHPSMGVAEVGRLAEAVQRGRAYCDEMTMSESWQTVRALALFLDDPQTAWRMGVHRTRVSSLRSAVRVLCGTLRLTPPKRGKNLKISAKEKRLLLFLLAASCVHDRMLVAAADGVLQPKQAMQVELPEVPDELLMDDGASALLDNLPQCIQEGILPGRKGVTIGKKSSSARKIRRKSVLFSIESAHPVAGLDDQRVRSVVFKQPALVDSLQGARGLMAAPLPERVLSAMQLRPRPLGSSALRGFVMGAGHAVDPSNWNPFEDGHGGETGWEQDEYGFESETWRSNLNPEGNPDFDLAFYGSDFSPPPCKAVQDAFSVVMSAHATKRGMYHGFCLSSLFLNKQSTLVACSHTTLFEQGEWALFREFYLTAVDTERAKLRSEFAVAVCKVFLEPAVRGNKGRRFAIRVKQQPMLTVDTFSRVLEEFSTPAGQ